MVCGLGTSLHFVRLDTAVFSAYSNTVCSGAYNHDLVWAVVESDMAEAMLFAFLGTPRDVVPNLVRFDDDPQVMT